MHTHIEYDFHTSATPKQIREILTDFSERRPDRWPALSRKWYEVYSVGETSADIREGQDKPVFWAKEHYDWSSPDTVTWTVVESEALAPGSYVSLTARPGAGGGSDVHGVWDRTGANRSGNMAAMVMRFFGKTFMSRYFKKVFDRLPDEPAS
jgi:hypothetical protein